MQAEKVDIPWDDIKLAPDDLHLLKGIAESAENGDAQAQFAIGMVLLSGEFMPTDHGTKFMEPKLAEGAKWLKKAADQGNTEAKKWLESLREVVKEQQAQNRAQSAPEQSASEPDEVRNLRDKAEHGDAKAQSDLGDLYYSGKGVAKDYDEARKWFLKAAGQGHVYAQYSIGWMYAHGQGFQKNDAEAVDWYRIAASQGETNAQGELKKMGLTWLSASEMKSLRDKAEQGDAKAQCDLGELYYSGKAVAKDYDEAAKWFCKAAAQGHGYAAYSIGWMYAHGQGFSKNDSEAVDWYRIAARLGETNAQGELKKMGLTW